MNRVYKDVCEALDNARKNGYTFYRCTSRQIAEDLRGLDFRCAMYSVQEVQRYVDLWIDAQLNK